MTLDALDGLVLALEMELRISLVIKHEVFAFPGVHRVAGLALVTEL